MGGLGQLVSALIGATEGIVPHWVWPVALVLLLVIAAPSMRRNAQTDAARRRFRLAGRLLGAAREAEEDAAFASLAHNREGLVVLADLALAEGRRRIVPLALARLRELGGREAEVRRIERELHGPQPATALEAVLTVERFAAQGLHAEAERRLQTALRRWPDDPDLRAVVLRPPEGGSPPA